MRSLAVSFFNNLEEVKILSMQIDETKRSAQALCDVRQDVLMGCDCIKSNVWNSWTPSKKLRRKYGKHVVKLSSHGPMTASLVLFGR